MTRRHPNSRREPMEPAMAETMLAVLRDAGGACVHRRRIAEALYGPAGDWPASALWYCDRLAIVLRAGGHRVQARHGQGYRIAGPDEPLFLRDRERRG